MVTTDEEGTLDGLEFLRLLFIRRRRLDIHQVGVVSLGCNQPDNLDTIGFCVVYTFNYLIHIVADCEKALVIRCVVVGLLVVIVAVTVGSVTIFPVLKKQTPIKTTRKDEKDKHTHR